MKKAVALGYSIGELAPKILAKGKGKIAQHIIDTARASGIFIREDPDLAEVLAQFNLNEHISEDLYEVIAELLVFIYNQNTAFGDYKEKS